MGFCAICGGHHDPNVQCTDRAGDILQHIGIIKTSKKHKREIRKLVTVSDRLMLKVFLAVMGFIFLFILLAIFLGKS
jgi:hypothetical protein